MRYESATPAAEVPVETFAYDDWGRWVSHLHVDGTTESRTFDTSTGFVTSHARGSITTTFGYSACTGGPLGQPCLVAGALHDTRSFDHDELGREIEATHGQYVRRTGRDRDGNPVRLYTQADGGPTPVTHLETRTYDARGFLRRQVQHDLETRGTTANLEWVNVPDGMGEVAQVAAPSGTSTSFVRDHRGRVLASTTGAVTTNLDYDRNGYVRRIWDAEGVIEERRYDRFDRVERVLDGDGATLRVDRTPDGEPRGLHLVDSRQLRWTPTPASRSLPSFG